MSDRIALLMSNMTLHDKFKMVEGAAGLENHGVGAAINPCIGLIKVSERLGIPNLCMGDGPSGVSNGLGNVTTFPAPIVVASSWDPDLMYDYAKAIAREHHDKGHNVALTPTINIQRAPLWGRNAESFSEDPFLTAELAVASVKGTQSENILASPKHFAAYNQETNRFGDAPKWSAANVIVSNRTLQEVYFPAFKAVVERARPGSIMTSYNKVNGYHASENKAILGDLFSWGFDDGFTVTDWYFGHRSTLESALAGQTMSMPGGKSDFGFDDFFSEKALSLVLRNGSLPQAVLDDMVRRVITPMFVHGLVDDHDLGDVNVDVRRQEHHDLSVKIVEEGDLDPGTILLKNDDAVLPLSSNVKKIAVVGPGGDYGALVSERYGGFVGSPNLNETLVTPLQGIRHRAGQEVEVVFAQAIPALEAYEPIPDSAFVSAKGSALRTTVFNNSNWSGATLFEDQVRNISQAFALDLNLTAVSPISAVHEGKLTPQDTGYHDFAIYAGGYAKLFIDNEEVVWLRKQGFVNYATGQAHLSASVPVKFRIEYSSAPAITSKGLRIAWSTPRMKTTLLEEALVAVKDADVAVVFVGNILSEGGDGTSLALPTTEDDLVQAIAQVNPNVVVVAQTNNPFLMPWLDQVKTVLIQWYAGEGVGTALARILFGDINPSGKLAMTFPPSDSVGPCSLTKSFPGSEADLISDYADVFYDEDLLVGYKWF
nr:uncharacterized protein CI109_005069 [Kwoniella shandongensis]KAA5526497.1 hypothetical protein CI109_005069 [Kwoniella shandongensis]